MYDVSGSLGALPIRLRSLLQQPLIQQLHQLTRWLLSQSFKMAARVPLDSTLRCFANVSISSGSPRDFTPEHGDEQAQLCLGQGLCLFLQVNGGRGGSGGIMG